jgi:hypothetical protein
VRRKEKRIMKKLVWLAVFCITSLVFLAGGAWAAEFCVSNVTDLQADLNAAAGNGEDNVIMVVQGTYIGHFSYSGGGHNITLRGGYTKGCASREVNPENTILDGGNTGRVLVLDDYSGGNFYVEGFTIRNGNTAGSGGGVFAESYSESGTAGTVTLANNIVTGNIAGYLGGGVFAHSVSDSGAAGNVTLVNNIVVGNSSANYGGGVCASSNSSGTAGAVTFTNNTVSGNTAGEYGGGTCLGVSGSSGGMVNAYNNIIWGNTAPTGGDVYLLKGTGFAYAHNNDFSTPAGSSWDQFVGNFTLDPLFVGGGDYHLQATSPCIDKGENFAPGIPSTDFEGETRIFDGDKNGTATVDMGADEYIPVSYSCVSNATGLQAALDAAVSNGAHDIIKVVQGTYAGNFTYSSNEGANITLEGGYTAGCAGRVLDPKKTILDGNHAGRVLLIETEYGGSIAVDRFTIRNGHIAGNVIGGGLYAIIWSGTGDAITITGNTFTGNYAANGGGLYAYSEADSGTITLTGNTFQGNSSFTGNYNDNGGGVFAESYSESGTAGTITITNNTITGNRAAYGGGVYGYGSGVVNCYNNIIWGNTASSGGGDIYFEGSGTFNGYNNNYTTMSGSWTHAASNINADPLFLDPGYWWDAGTPSDPSDDHWFPGDYHLTSASPCIDKGDNSAPGLPATDFEGDPRTIGSAPDIGADEFSVLPANGTIFSGCSLINKYQPSFQWRFTETFKSFTIYFSTSPTDFTTKGILIKKANIKGTKFSYTPSSGVWKKIFTVAYHGGGDIPWTYWKVVGTRTNKSTASSVVWHFTVDAPYPPEITYPAEGAALSASTPPGFNCLSNCNVKFRLEISSDENFSDPKKIKAFTYSVKDPNDYFWSGKALSSGQWKSVQKLIGTGTGYFRIKGWDVIKRETHSETRSFTITTP